MNKTQLPAPLDAFLESFRAMVLLSRMLEFSLARSAKTRAMRAFHAAAAQAILASALLVLTLEPLAQGAEGVFRSYPADYQKLFIQIVHEFHARQFDAVMADLKRADSIVPDTPMALNTRGAVAIELRNFDEGEKYCKQALEKDPTFFAARFNLAEIPFLQKKYVEARQIYQKLLAEDPSNELLQFRVFMTYLLAGDDAKAEAKLDKMKFLSDTPSYYYAHAAWEFAHGNREQGLSWVKSGNWVFSAEKSVPFAEVMYDLQWLERPKSAEPEKKAPAAPKMELTQPPAAASQLQSVHQ